MLLASLFSSPPTVRRKKKEMASLIIRRQWLGFDFLADNGLIKLAIRLVKNGSEKDYEVIIDKLLDIKVSHQYAPTPKYLNPFFHYS